MDLTLEKLREVTGGRWAIGAIDSVRTRTCDLRTIVRGRVVIDSRQVEPGDIFWALPGRHHNGAEFATQAVTRGACGVVAGRAVEVPSGAWSLQVDDPQVALWKLAAWQRRQFTGSVVGVTGSVGKTTTRDMIHAVLGSNQNGWASRGNQNNHLGLPLSILGLQPQHDYAVFELGASARGEIAALAELCQPTIGAITRIGEAHLGGFGSRQEIAAAKGELLAALPADGWAVLNGDDRWLRRLAAKAPCKVALVGRSGDCDLIPTRVESGSGQLTFYLGTERFEVPVWGRHHLTSALMAIAIGQLSGVSLAAAAEALATFEPQPMRCQVSRCAGSTIIDDSYNASPAAMSAALDLLREIDAAGRRIVVCGDMRELGDESAQSHRQLGSEIVTRCGADLLVACGDFAQEVVAGAREAGMSSRRALACRMPEETVPLVRQWIVPGDVVLVKGSRALGMERVVAALQTRSHAKAA